MVLTLPFTGLEYKLFSSNMKMKSLFSKKIVDLDFQNTYLLVYSNNISNNKRMRFAVVVVLKFYLTL